MSSSASRPTYTSHPTNTTILSTTSYNTSSTSHHSTTETALTTPDLGSPTSTPGKSGGKLRSTAQGQEHMGAIMEGSEEGGTTVMMDSRYADEGPRRRSIELGRGPSVKDRASIFEQGRQQQSDSPVPGSRGRRLPLPVLPPPMDRTRSTSPLRITRRVSSNTGNGSITPTTPTNARRVPVPATAPVQRTTLRDEGNERLAPAQANSPELKRGTGSAKRMIQQWESLPGTPTAVMERRPRFPPGSGSVGMGSPHSARVMSREYLEQKPLPIPRATPIPASSPSNYTYTHSAPGPSHHHSPASRTTYAPSPLQHLQTPTQPNRKRSNTLTPSPSSYSLSPSPSGGEKRKKMGGRSPLKEMMNLFGGGMQAISRKAKGKSKDKGFGYGYGMGRSESFGLGDDSGSEERLGTNGLPGGIVFSDRMGEEEMNGKEPLDPNVIRTSPVMYLIPTPCSSYSPWGSWLSSWATLTPSTLHITYCPTSQGLQSGHSTPRRVFSGTKPSQSQTTAVQFSQIPQPEPGTTPDVELAMMDCVEVRSLRRDEVKGRGIPPVPEGVGTEVLEILWRDGSKRYIGVEGVAGRLGWVSSIWDVLLACKSSQPSALPPPSPVVSAVHVNNQSPTALPYLNPAQPSYPPLPVPAPRGEMTDFQTRLYNLEAKSSGASSAPPVQKVGDTWVAASALGAPNSDVETPRPDLAKKDSPDALRNSVQRMFETGPDIDHDGDIEMNSQPRATTEPPQLPPLSPIYKASSSQGGHSAMSERIKAWQPTATDTERELSIFSRTSSKRSTASADRISVNVPYSEIDRENGFPKSETALSFDPNDLNPSRSASQVRRAPSAVAEDRPRRYGMVGGRKDTMPMPVLEERSMDGMSGSGSGFEDDMLAKPPTHISHVTFPKPSVGGIVHIPSQAIGNCDGGSRQQRQLSTIPSAPTSSCETGPSTEMQTPRTGHSSITTVLSATDPTVIAKLDDHSNEHSTLAKQIDGVSVDLHRIISSLGGLVESTKNPIVPKNLDDKLNTIGLDVKGIENALQLSQLATNRQLSSAVQTEEMGEMHNKLDNIAKLCEQLLSSKQGTSAVASMGVGAGAAALGLADVKMEETRSETTPGGTATNAVNTKGSTLSVSNSDEVKNAGEEVAQIMADLTGGSTKPSPRLGGIQVLHNISNPPSPSPASADGAAASSSDTGALSAEATKQVGEVLALVTELKEARSIQTQQTTDIARYLNELNTWLEKFVLNSSTEISSMSKRLTTLVGSDEPLTNPDGTPQTGLPDLVADVHSMMTEQKRRNDSEGMVGQRLDALLRMMGEDKERQASQQGMVEQVLSSLERQRQDNEILLRAVATDLTAEIRGEKMRFIEAMQQATSVNVSHHVEEFKKLLSAEVNRSMAELGQMREEKKVLEQQISDLFALMAKHGPVVGGGGIGGGKGKGRGVMLPISPQPMGRGLPPPPGR
ncbi:hypothetical protein CI109_103700 [Kwoniella shandongensis]|uniref:Uncharacterized protein n=1 Tax=Kwoniella shandongensis TaxID=1734106 RepID=A0A5M6C821_9TREE|nr:uncharacterized protein CI109_000603 [Kwoniella shandongensis]KAA5531031.1 hypothetical protein CI109_000603 [Kwoniella shandongensis]